MIINCVTSYLPDTIVLNSFFSENYGIPEENIVSKSGIKQRRRTQRFENTSTMGIEAVQKSLSKLPFPIDTVDLIVGATYTPYDTVGTLAHAVQRQFNIANAKCFTVDSACSSFVNAIELVDCYFAAKRASKALIVVSENNSVYNDYSDKKSGFLWGDGAAAVFISNETYSDEGFEVLDVHTLGLGHVGKSVDAICLKPAKEGLKMPFGKDVFQYACTYMIQETEQILRRNGIPVTQLNYFIPHQANARITNYVGEKLNLKPAQILSNIELFGNTGSASTPIVLSQNQEKFKPNDTIVIAVFGGGYSSGAVLLKKN